MLSRLVVIKYFKHFLKHIYKKFIKFGLFFSFFYSVNMTEKKVVFCKYCKSISFSIIANNNIYCSEIKYKDGFAPLNVFEIGKYEDKSPILIGCDNIFVNNERIIIWDNEILRNFIIEHIDKEFIREKVNYIKNGCSAIDSLLNKDYKTIVEVAKVKLKKGDKNSGHYYIIDNTICYKNYESFENRNHENFNIGTTGSKYEIVPDSQLDLKIIEDIKIELKDKEDIEKFNILKKYWSNGYFGKKIQILKEEISKLKIDDSFDFNKVTDFKNYIIEYIKRNTNINDDYYGKKEENVDDIIKLGYIDEELNKKIKEFEAKRDVVLNKIKEDKEEVDNKKENKQVKDKNKKPCSGK